MGSQNLFSSRNFLYCYLNVLYPDVFKQKGRLVISLTNFMNTETSTPVALSYEEVSALRSENAWIIDCRTPDEFIQGFIPESVYFSPEDNIYLDESLLLPIENPAIVVCIEGDEEKVISILREKGLQHIAGYLQGGYENWKCNSD